MAPSFFFFSTEVTGPNEPYVHVHHKAGVELTGLLSQMKVNGTPRLTCSRGFLNVQLDALVLRRPVDEIPGDC